MCSQDLIILVEPMTKCYFAAGNLIVRTSGVSIQLLRSWLELPGIK